MSDDSVTEMAVPLKNIFKRGGGVEKKKKKGVGKSSFDTSLAAWIHVDLFTFSLVLFCFCFFASRRATLGSHADDACKFFIVH